MSVEPHPPAGGVPLDELQQEGVASLLVGALDEVGGATGPDGTEAEFVRYWAAAYPEGALVLLMVNAHVVCQGTV